MKKDQEFAEKKFANGVKQTGADRKFTKKRPNILKMCNHIQTVAIVHYNDPEYLITECCVTDDMATLALSMKLRKKYTLEEVTARTKFTSEKVKELLEGLGQFGIVMEDPKDEDRNCTIYWIPIFVPGIMEMFMANLPALKKYPQAAQAFSEFSLQRSKMLCTALPIGTGPMRVIPIERTLDGDSHSENYETISYYMDKYEDFTVAPCSCRNARKVMGEGCGHLAEDICIQVGDAARFYEKTGRGKRITREKAKEILRKAEDDGLMHEITNLDGNGDIHAICNCCGCSCFSIRNAEYYHTNQMVRSNYTATVNKANCVACGECVENCPVNAVKLGRKVCAETPIRLKKAIKLAQPKFSENHIWNKKDWNPDYRFNREFCIPEMGTAPCKVACPAHIAVQGYLKLAGEGRYEDALELIKSKNPFPAVCGRICNRACELNCTRGEIDKPVAIDEVKKFIAEQDLNKKTRYVPKVHHDYGDKKIAIIGSGPSGLTCAYFLALDGYDITVFEKTNKLGGMLSLGIPSFRLEKDVIDAEIDIIKQLGVKFQINTEVGKDVTIPQLRKQGFAGFYVAIGAQGGRALRIEGEDNADVISGVEFLRNVNLGEFKGLKENVIVIGGGNVAVDVARTATRVGAKSVNLFCLEGEGEMPAADDELEETVKDGVKINNSWGPKRIVVKDGKVTGVEFKKCTRVFDEDKKFSPIYDEKNTKIVPCDQVLVSIGQSILWNDLLKGTKVEFNRNNTAIADELTCQTAEPDIFVGGDDYTGPKFCINAIATGREAAISLHRYVQPGQSLLVARVQTPYISMDKDNAEFSGYDRTSRQQFARISHKDEFKDDRKVFTEEQVKKEASRCLGCGAAYVDPTMCIGCGLCVTECKFDAIHLEKTSTEHGVTYEQLPVKIAKHMVSRALKIVITPQNRKYKEVK